MSVPPRPRPARPRGARPRPARRGLLALAGCLLLGGGAAAAGGAAQAGTGDPAGTAATTVPVLGFQEQWDRPGLIGQDAPGLASVGVDGVALHEDGAGVTAPDPTARTQRDRAHRAHLPAYLLVANWSDRVGDFSEPMAHRMLGVAAHRDAVADALARTVRAQHWDGVNVDLESLTGRDRTGLTAFVRRLRHDLPHRTLSIDLMNETSAAGMRAAGYDLTALGRLLDRVVLMGYDQHGPWERTPGPVGALAWERKGLAVLRAAMPARTIVLGVAGYGYGWRPHTVATLGDARARALVHADGAKPRWDATAGEWTAHLSDGSTLWWSDARSLDVRRALARSLHLGGLAVWDLALSDPIA